MVGSEDRDAVRTYDLAFVVKNDDCDRFLKTHILLDLCFTICDENKIVVGFEDRDNV